jgi:hypothetical protein
MNAVNNVVGLEIFGLGAHGLLSYHNTITGTDNVLNI